MNHICGPSNDSLDSDASHGDGTPDNSRQHGDRAEETAGPAPKSRRSRSASGRGETKGNSDRNRRKEPYIPSRRDILATILRLSQLVAIGVLSPQRSHAMVQALTVVLKNMPEDAPGKNGKVSSAQLNEFLREQPALLHALGPLLSDEQLAEISDDLEDDEEQDRGDDADDRDAGEEDDHH